MGNTSKGYALLLTIIIAMSCLTALFINLADAQTIPKPDAPELTVAFLNHSYDVPPTTTTTTNAYTGENIVTTKEGYHIQNDSFVLSLKAQPLSENSQVNGSMIRLFFIVQSKGPYADYWRNLTYVGGGSLPLMYTENGCSQKVMELAGNNGTTYAEEGGYNNYGYDGYVGGQYGGQVMFRAMSVIGYVFTVQDPISAFNARHPYHQEFVALQSSDWSGIQTIDVPANISPTITPSVPSSSTQTPNATDTNSATDLHLENQQWTYFALIGTVAVLSLAVVSLSVYVRRIKKQLPKQ